MSKPKYICFEGLDGSGKSTVFEKVLKALRDKGVKVHALCPTHKPAQLDEMEKIFAENKILSNDSFFRQLIYAYRSNKAAELIDWNSDLILGDRSVITSYVCRWSESDEANRALVDRVNSLEYKIPAPNEVLYLEVPHEILQKRLNLRGGQNFDETPKRSLEMRRAYDILRSTPNLIARLKDTRWHTINGDQTEERVFQEAWRKILELLDNQVKNF